MRPICCDKTHGKHGPWSEEEDAKMVAHVSKHGAGNWTSVPKKAGLRRCGKSCRLRWTNYLKPDLKHESFAAEEEELIIKLHAAIGSRWSIIAQQLPGRSDNDVKNYWNTRLKKKLKEKGIDPITHRPFSHILRDYESIGGTSPGTRNITSINRDIKNTFLPSTSGFPSPGPNSQNSLSKADVEQPQLGLGLLAQLQAIKLVTETSMGCSFPSPPLPPSSSPSSSSSSSAASSQSFSWSKFLLEDTVLQSDGSAPVQGETMVEPSTEDSIPAKNNAFQGEAHPGGSQACTSSPSSESSFVEAMLKRDREMYFMEFPELWEEPHY